MKLGVDGYFGNKKSLKYSFWATILRVYNNNYYNNNYYYYN